MGRFVRGSPSHCPPPNPFTTDHHHDICFLLHEPHRKSHNDLPSKLLPSPKRHNALSLQVPPLLNNLPLTPNFPQRHRLRPTDAAIVLPPVEPPPIRADEALEVVQRVERFEEVRGEGEEDGGGIDAGGAGVGRRRDGLCVRGMWRRVRAQEKARVTFGFNTKTKTDDGKRE